MSTTINPKPEARDSATPPAWSVHRVDDNGNRFVVAAGLTKDSAEQMARQMESLWHKQTYWIAGDSRRH